MGALTIFVIYSTLIDLVNNFLVKDSFSIISTVGISGSGAGYTIVQFLIDFIIGIYFARNKVNIKLWILLVTYILSAITMTLLEPRFNSVWNYSSIFTVITATCLFLLFKKITLKSFAVNFVAKSVFAIFCFHVSFFANELWKNLLITEVHIAGNTAKMIFWYCVSIFGMFLFGLIVDLIVRYTIDKVKNRLLKKITIGYEL